MLDRLKTFCRQIESSRECCQDHLGLEKLVMFGELSLQRGCKYAWLDTACIDKTSSAELEESIRSMYSWYRNSAFCVIHLGDTSGLHDIRSDPWFTRGWTLQELLAPKVVKFFDRKWRPMSSNENDKTPSPLLDAVSAATDIPEVQLLDFAPGSQGVRNIMLWASRRRTTRVEDVAYSLIGLFDVSLSIAYGEGWRAFYRLQEELIRKSSDMGLFAW
ncbi:hypothetical protein HYDPIDRAFT_89820, partial [Hydnomerulius pinastri MD-312]